MNFFQNRISNSATWILSTFLLIVINISVMGQDSLSVMVADSVKAKANHSNILTQGQDSLKDNRKVYLNKVKRSSINSGKGMVRFIQDERIPTLNQIIKDHPYEHKGFRVQIIFGSKTIVNNKKASFESKFSYRTYVDYLPPNFRLRVGNFPTKQLAEKHLYNIRKSFPNSYIVKDKINTPSDYK